MLKQLKLSRSMIARTDAVSTDLPLGQLVPGSLARIRSLAAPSPDISEDSLDRLSELGFVTGALVEVLHIAPWGDPIAVKVDRLTVALRRHEADAIAVRLVP
ncbi:MAG: ferrous iron transport protein A [Rhodothalassiaceae bacterium]